MAGSALYRSLKLSGSPKFNPPFGSRRRPSPDGLPTDDDTSRPSRPSRRVDSAFSRNRRRLDAVLFERELAERLREPWEDDEGAQSQSPSPPMPG